MMNRDTLSREHAEIDALASRILILLTAEPHDLSGLVSLRWRMIRLLFAHLAKEDKLLYPELHNHPHAPVRQLADRFVAEMGNLSVSVTDYVRDWPVDRALADWTGFGVQTRKIIAALKKRIGREEAELYPLLTARN